MFSEEYHHSDKSVISVSQGVVLSSFQPDPILQCVARQDNQHRKLLRLFLSSFQKYRQVLQTVSAHSVPLTPFPHRMLFFHIHTESLSDMPFFSRMLTAITIQRIPKYFRFWIIFPVRPINASHCITLHCIGR